MAASGRVLRYVAQAGGVPLVLGTFGSAAWRVPARDAFIGWDPVQRAERLERVISNQRLCVLPAAGQVPFAASRALAAMLRRLPGDHEAAFGVRPAACESFTDPSAHAGTAYKACGFTEAGRTAGYGRTRGAAYYHRHGQPKAYWIKELAPGGLAALRAAFDSRPLTGRPGPDFNKLNMSRGRRVAAGVPGEGERSPQAEGSAARPGRDPGGGRGGPAVRGGLGLCGRAVRADDAAAGPGPLRHPVQHAAGRYVPPSHKTIKRAVRKVDARAADEQMCAWLRAEAAAGRLTWRWRHIAVDGKTVRGARDGQDAPHLLSAYDVTAGTVLGQDSVERKPTRSAASSPCCKPSSTATPAAATMTAATTTAAAAPAPAPGGAQRRKKEEKEKEKEKEKESWSSCPPTPCTPRPGTSRR